MPEQETLDSKYLTLFNTAADGKVKAPGRVCMMGEHTDYNHGFVLPFALDLAATVLFRVRDDSRVRVRSLAYPDYEDTFDITGEVARCDQNWANYVRGVFYITRDYGFRLNHGLDLLISSTLPQNAGLASSGAMSVAVAGAIQKAFNLPLDKRSLALIAEKAENDFYGRHCGIMDPLTATQAHADHLLLIDCDEFNVEQIPFPEDLTVIIFNSNAHKNLVGTEFNNLRRACENAADVMEVSSLRHATLDTLQTHERAMEHVEYRRAYHIITEIERTKQLAQAFITGNHRYIYQLMYDSHESLKVNFENTIPEIDALVSFCREELNGNIGCRMTGGGFGGSVIALCPPKDAQTVAGNVSRKYYERFSISSQVHICRPGNGIRVQWNNDSR